MGDSDFDRALDALLGDDPVDLPPDDASLDAIRVLSVIGRASRAVLFGVAAPAHERRVWGHLEIREELGRGSSGTVYRAWDPRLAREVALKLLDPLGASVRDALEEGRLLARIHHPNVVDVYGADTFDGVSGLWMELVEGESLDDLLIRDGRMSVAEALIIGVDLAGALGTVHAAGIVHRDVKARNVVRQRGGRLVLMDFGAGSGAEVTASPIDGVGTPLYMAPEVLEGGPASPRSDLYGLGVLLYHLVTLTYPVAAADVDALRAAHRARALAVGGGSHVELPFEHADVPAAVRAVIERACAPEAGNRFASARDLEAALGDALAAVTLRTRVVPQVTRRWRRWRRTVLATSAAAAMLLVTLVALWDTGTGRAARRTAGLQVPPRSPLYFVFGGAIGILDRGALRLLSGASQGALALAVTERFGTRVLPGTPPWAGAVWFKPDGTPERAPAGIGGVCCFYDGATDGQFNYSLRQDSTLLEPIGSRPLAPPAIVRFSLEWTNPTVLFEIGPHHEGGVLEPYHGIAYAAAIDAFVLTQGMAEGYTRVEIWGRDGRRRARWPLRFHASSIAADSADGTLWVTRNDLHARTIHLENLDTQGGTLGSFEIAKPFTPVDAGGLEFAWPSQ